MMGGKNGELEHRMELAVAREREGLMKLKA
jgi:hypothetical protein